MPAPKRPYRMSDIQALLAPHAQNAQRYVAQRRQQEAANQQASNVPRYFDLKNIADSNPMPEPEKDTGLLGSAEFLAQSWLGGGLTGLAYEGLTGEKMFDLSDYDPNTLERAAAGLLDFVSPVDLAALAVGGGIGKVAGEGVKLAAKPVLQTALKQGLREGGAFAAQSAARAAGEDMVYGEGFDLSNTLVGGLKGLAIGGTAGVAGGAARAAVKSGAAKAILGTGAEIAAFGGVAPVVEEGRAPNLDDFLNAGYAIAAFKVAGYAGSKVKGLYDRMAVRDAKKVQAAVESGVPYEDAVADQLYGALEKKHDPAVLLRLSGAKEGEQIGTLGDLITNKTIRDRFSGELDVPIVIDNGSNRFAGKADFAGGKIRINNALGDSKAVQLKTIIEEASHFRDRRLGKEFTKYDPNKISEAEYNALPEEVRARQFTKYISRLKDKPEPTSGAPREEVSVPSEPDPSLELLKNASRGQMVDEALRLGIPEEQAVRMSPQELRFALSGGRLENVPVVPKPKVRAVKAETLNKAEKRALGLQKVKEQRAKVVVSNPLPKSVAAAVESKPTGLKKTYAVTEATDKTSLVGLLEKAEKEGAVVKPSAEFRMTEQFKQFGREGWVRYEKGQPYFVNPVSAKKVAMGEAHRRRVEAMSDGAYGEQAFSIRFNLTKAMSGTGMRENDPTLFRQVRSSLSEFIPDAVKQAKNRLTTATGKSFIDDILRTDNYQNRLKGTWLSELREAGMVKGKDEAWGRSMADQLDGKAPMTAEGHAIRRILDEVIGTAQGAGMKVRRHADYYPVWIKREIATAMWDDLAALERELSGAKTFTDEMIAGKLKNKSQFLQQAITRLTEQGKSYESALRTVNREVSAQLFHKGSFEKARGVEIFPSEFYERDARVVIPAYINAFSERIAQSKFFGQEAGRVVEILDKIGAEKPNERPIAEEIYRQFTGAVNSDPTRKFRTQTARDIADLYTNYQGLTKISLGTATFANMWQPLISFIPDVGLWRSIKGGANALSAETRGRIERSGATDVDVLHQMLGFRSDGRFPNFEKVAEKLSNLSGFRPINRLLQYWSAASAEVAIKDWHKVAQGTGRRAEWAKARLKDLQIDSSKPLSEEALMEGMYRFAVDSQLQKNVLNEPLAFNDPKLRPLFLFKRFGYRQFTYMKDMLIREGERGNYMPAVRLALGGALGGTAAIAGFNAIRGFMSGQSYYYRQPDNVFEDIYNKIAAIGAFGVMSDITRLDQQMTMADRFKFAATPVFWSDLEKTVEAYNNVARDWERYGDAWLVTKRNVHSAFNVVGGNVAQASKRLLTDEQKKRGLARLKGKEKREIYLAILAGNGRLASDKIADWNRNNRGNAITMEDINIKEVSDFMKRELDAKLKASGLSKDGEDAGEYRKRFREKRMEDLKRLKELRGTVTQAASQVR